MVKVPSVCFQNGVSMPMVGLGTWQSTDEVVKSAVKMAIRSGYRLIDTAELYGNEGAIGEALQELYKENIVKREEIFITTKLLHVHMDSHDEQEKYLRESLSRLQTQYVDLYLAHLPPVSSLPITVEDVWRGMEKLYNKKLARSIGVSNYSIPQMERVLKMATIPIHNLQIEIHRYLPQHDLVNFCKKHKISVTSYGSLGSPRRTDVDVFQWTVAPDAMKDNLILKLSAKYHKSPAQILLGWLIARGVCVIPKSVNGERIRENLEIFDIGFSSEEISELDRCEKNYRLFAWDMLAGTPEDPFSDERQK